LEAFRDGNIHFLRLDRGEDVTSQVTAYCDSVGIISAVVSGIGAVEDVEVGYYDLRAREYLKRKLDGIFELLSLAGNITSVDGKAFMHAHAVLGSREFTIHGGHFFKGKVAVTGEIYLIDSRLPLTRRMNEAVGLKLVAV